MIFIFFSLFAAFEGLLRSPSVTELQESCCVDQIKLRCVFQLRPSQGSERVLGRGEAGRFLQITASFEQLTIQVEGGEADKGEGIDASFLCRHTARLTDVYALRRPTGPGTCAQ